MVYGGTELVLFARRSGVPQSLARSNEHLLLAIASTGISCQAPLQNSAIYSYLVEDIALLQTEESKQQPALAPSKQGPALRSVPLFSSCPSNRLLLLPLGCNEQRTANSKPTANCKPPHASAQINWELTAPIAILPRSPKRITRITVDQPPPPLPPSHHTRGPQTSSTPTPPTPPFPARFPRFSRLRHVASAGPSSRYLPPGPQSHLSCVCCCTIAIHRTNPRALCRKPHNPGFLLPASPFRRLLSSSF